MRLLVCGGRRYGNNRFLHKFLDAINIVHGPVDVLINGGAKGADTLAQEWAEHNKIHVETYMAEWDKYGRSAGYIRNGEILKIGKPDMVVCFPGGKGTAHMRDLAKKADISVIEGGKNGHR